MLLLPALTMTDKQRFWNKIQVTNHCHLWTGACNSIDTPVPRFMIGRVLYTASRVAWFIATGNDPGELLVCHDCRPLLDNKLCMNVKHLWLGSDRDNKLDAYQKGQNQHQEHTIGNFHLRTLETLDFSILKDGVNRNLVINLDVVVNLLTRL